MEYVLKLRLDRHVGSVGELVVDMDLEPAEAVAGWNLVPHTFTRITTPISGARYQPTGRDIVFLIPRRALLRQIRISLADSAQVEMQWIMFERVVGVVHPTLATKGRLAHMRTTKKSITGQTFTTTSSLDQVLTLPIDIKNEYRDEVTAVLYALDGLDAFGVDPCGVESAFLANETIPYRVNGFTRNMVVANTFKGFSGHDGIDVLGGTGKIELRETYFTDRPITREPDTADDRFIRVTADGACRVTEDGELRTWRL